MIFRYHKWAPNNFIEKIDGEWFDQDGQLFPYAEKYLKIFASENQYASLITEQELVSKLPEESKTEQLYLDIG